MKIEIFRLVFLSLSLSFLFWRAQVRNSSLSLSHTNNQIKSTTESVKVAVNNCVARLDAFAHADSGLLSVENICYTPSNWRASHRCEFSNVDLRWLVVENYVDNTHMSTEKIQKQYMT